MTPSRDSTGRKVLRLKPNTAPERRAYEVGETLHLEGSTYVVTGHEGAYHTKLEREDGHQRTLSTRFIFHVLQEEFLGRRKLD